jgi:ATP-dependent RNA helicase DDX52/ROK1
VNIVRSLVPSTLIFVQNKTRGIELYHELIYEGVKVNVIHGDRIKEDRDDIVMKFRNGKISFLICTDLMSRGIDFMGVNSVINYDFPQSIVSYIHRVGRTGRAGKKGQAFTFFTDADIEFLRSIANLMKKSGCDVKPWMLELKNPSRKRWKELEKNPNKRKTISSSIKQNTDMSFLKVIKNFAKRDKKKNMKAKESSDPMIKDIEQSSEPAAKDVVQYSDEDEQAQYLDELKYAPKEIPYYNPDNSGDNDVDIEEYDELSE